MEGITRRLFLRNTAAAGAVGATVAVPAVASEPEMTPREQAIWHMRELARLAREAGAQSSAIMVVGCYETRSTLFILGHDDNLIDNGSMFAGSDA